jgi:hypothetical protein
LDWGATATGDCATAINNAIASLASLNKPQTLVVPDGNWAIASPINLKKGVSLRLTSGAVISALPGFTGQAMIITDTAGFNTHAIDAALRDGISGGKLDGKNVAAIGIQVHQSRYFLISDLVIEGCTTKGIEVGSPSASSPSYEVMCSNLRLWRGEYLSATGSIGLDLQRCTDCYVYNVVVIGYDIGFRDGDSANLNSSNDFLLCHAWARPANGNQSISFLCNGGNSSFVSCYADSPVKRAVNGDTSSAGQTCYGFYITRPNVRVIGGRVYANLLVGVNDTVYGVFTGSLASNCSIVGLHFDGQSDGAKTVNLKADIDPASNFANLVIIGWTYGSFVGSFKAWNQFNGNFGVAGGFTKVAFGRTSGTERLEIFGGNTKIIKDTFNNGGCLMFQNLNVSTTNSQYLWYSTTGVLRKMTGLTMPTNWDTDGGFANCNPPSALQNIGTTTTISVLSDVIPIASNAAITHQGNPSIAIANVLNGTLIKLLNVGSHAIALQDVSTFANGKLSLGGSNKTLNPGQFLQLLFYQGLWYLQG